MTSNEAITLLKDLEDKLDSYCELNEEGKTAFRMAIESIELFGNSERLPYAQPQRMRGRWIHDGYDFPHGCDWIHCSMCGKRGINVPADLTNYCPNCGADMRNDIDIVKDIIHKAIDNSIWAEDAYPNIKERLHKAVDEYEEENDE